VRESISTVIVPSAFLVTAYAGSVPAERKTTPALTAAASTAASPPATASRGGRRNARRRPRPAGSAVTIVRSSSSTSSRPRIRAAVRNSFAFRRRSPATTLRAIPNNQAAGSPRLRR